MRHRARRDGFGKERDRLRVAQVAARLIVEHGLGDWTLAKRKAARQLMLPDTTAMPSNDEIEVALAEHHALFGGEAHEESLRAMRALALQWMDRLAEWQPLLVGGVAAGWATEHKLGTTDVKELRSKPEVRDMVQRAIDEVNSKVARVEQIKKFEILPHDLTQETGELTPTLKVKRNVVYEKYADEFKALYGD